MDQTIVINGVEYSKKEVNNDHVVVRTYSAGVFAGVLVERNGMEVKLANARRLWKWSGAASLSELAVRGVDPDGCKFPVCVPSIILTQAIEIIPMSNEAWESVMEVPEWSAQ